jgi:hypothetical protein
LGKKKTKKLTPLEKPVNQHHHIYIKLEKDKINVLTPLENLSTNNMSLTFVLCEGEFGSIV